MFWNVLYTFRTVSHGAEYLLGVASCETTLGPVVGMSELMAEYTGSNWPRH